MKNKIKNIIITILSLTALITTTWLISIYHYQPKSIVVWKDCVPDSESAINIAQVVYKAYFNKDFEASEFDCVENDTGWQVWLRTFDTQDNKNLIFMDGGVFINRKNGTIEAALISDKEVEDHYIYKKSKE